MDGRVRGRVTAVASSAPPTPVAAAVHGVSAPVTLSQPLLVTDFGALLEADRQGLQAWSGPDIDPRFVNGGRAAQAAVAVSTARARTRHMTLLEDTGLVHFNAQPAETPPVTGPATSVEPIKPVLAPATSTTQGASIPAMSLLRPAAGTASTPAWWSSSASPRSA